MKANESVCGNDLVKREKVQYLNKAIKKIIMIING